MDKGNLFAWLALPLWVPVSLYCFRSYTAPRAVAWTLIGGALFLPQGVAYDLPVIPPFDKHGVSAIWALIGCWLWHRRRVRWSRAFSGIGSLFILMVAGRIGTALTNSDPIPIAGAVLQACTLYDGVADSINVALVQWLPFFLGRTVYRSFDDLKTLLRCLASLGMIYSVLALIEVRLSPQLHNWIYGFGQHEWLQVIRGGGFRPMVFMEHGLAVALFMTTVTLAAGTLAKLRVPIARLNATTATTWLALVLVLCKSTAAIIYAIITLPVLAWGTSRRIASFAAVLAAFILLYPVLRLAEALPIDMVVAQATSISEDRAESLQFRVDNEDRLLERGSERPILGWGGYGRGRIFDEDGRDISVTDSAWIIAFGNHGAVGFLTLFGVITFPVIYAYRRLRSTNLSSITNALAAFGLIVAVNAFDLLLNGLFSSLVIFFAGSLLGMTEGLGSSAHSRTSYGNRNPAARSVSHQAKRPL